MKGASKLRVREEAGTDGYHFLFRDGKVAPPRTVPLVRTVLLGYPTVGKDNDSPDGRRLSVLQVIYYFALDRSGYMKRR